MSKTIKVEIRSNGVPPFLIGSCHVIPVDTRGRPLDPAWSRRLQNAKHDGGSVVTVTESKATKTNAKEHTDGK